MKLATCAFLSSLASPSIILVNAFVPTSTTTSPSPTTTWGVSNARRQLILFASSGYLDDMKTNWEEEDDSNVEKVSMDSGNNILDEGEEESEGGREYLNELKTNWDVEEDDTCITDDYTDVNGGNDRNDENIMLSTNNMIKSILITASSTDRGQFASIDQKKQMTKLIESLEKIQTDQAPVKSTSIQGTWELLYSSTQLFRSSPFFMAGRAVCKTDEEAQRYDWFCDMHRAALAISEIAKVRQVISSTRMTSEFEVNVGSVPFLNDFTPFSYSGGLPFTITGAIVSSADITPTNDGKAWEIFMDTVEIKGSNVPLLRKVLDQGLKLRSRGLGSFLEDNVENYSNPKPIFTTTYFDDDIRVSRDEDGQIFVYGKISDCTEPSNYSSVDADLGIPKLLEGLNDNFFKISI